MRTRISAFLLALCATMPAISAGPNDPRAVDLWSMYSRDGNCLEIPRCIDGYITRVHKREWMPLYLSDVGVPSNAERIFVVGMLNVTHPAADTSTCKVFVMFANDEGMADVEARDDRQWVFRVLSHISLRDTQGTPLRPQNGRIWMRYWFSGTGDYDAGYCSYGIRLSVADWD